MLNSHAEGEARVRRDIENSFLDNGKWSVVANPDSCAFEKLLEGSMEESVEKLIEGVEMMNPALQAHLFHRVWEVRGRVHGVHHDLGRCAFFCSPEVPGCYHLVGQQRVEFLLSYQGESGICR